MKVHKITFIDTAEPGIWGAVSLARHEHAKAMRYKRDKSWSLYMHCRTSRDHMMHAIRVIARGLCRTMERSNNAERQRRLRQPAA